MEIQILDAGNLDSSEYPFLVFSIQKSFQCFIPSWSSRLNPEDRINRKPEVLKNDQTTQKAIANWRINKWLQTYSFVFTNAFSLSLFLLAPFSFRPDKYNNMTKLPLQTVMEAMIWVSD